MKEGKGYSGQRMCVFEGDDVGFSCASINMSFYSDS